MFIHEYESKPVRVKAALVAANNIREVAAWCFGAAEIDIVTGHGVGVVVHTLNGDATAKLGHWVIQGENDFYPCDPDTFNARWELVQDGE